MAGIGPGDLHIDERLPLGLVPGVNQTLGVLLAARAQAFLLTGLRILAVVGAPRPRRKRRYRCFISVLTVVSLKQLRSNVLASIDRAVGG